VVWSERKQRRWGSKEGLAEVSRAGIFVYRVGIDRARAGKLRRKGSETSTTAKVPYIEKWGSQGDPFGKFSPINLFHRAKRRGKKALGKG